MNLNPIQWALRPLRNYARFSGRAPRPEFWWFAASVVLIYALLYVLVLGSLLSIEASGTDYPSPGFVGIIGVAGILMLVLWLALLVPSIAVQARRLHDTDRSAWWVGGFYLLYGVYIALWFGSVGSMLGADVSEPSGPPAALDAVFAVTMVVGLILLAYLIVLLVFYCLPGTRGTNRFGADPYGSDMEQVFG